MALCVGLLKSLIVSTRTTLNAARSTIRKPRLLPTLAVGALSCVLLVTSVLQLSSKNLAADHSLKVYVANVSDEVGMLLLMMARPSLLSSATAFNTPAVPRASATRSVLGFSFTGRHCRHVCEWHTLKPLLLAANQQTAHHLQRC